MTDFATFAKTVLAIAAVVILGAGFVLGRACAPDADPVLPAVIVVDSLGDNRAAFDSAQARLKREAEAANRKAEEARKESARHRRAAASLRDSLDLVLADTAGPDSTAVWREVAHLAIARGDTLERALSLADAEARYERERANRAEERAENETRRRIIAEDAAAQLANVIEDMEPKCRVGPLPCPSRTVTALITAGATGYALARTY